MLKTVVTEPGYVQCVCLCQCVAQGVTWFIYMCCNLRGGNVEMSVVYLVLGYVHSSAAVFQSTEPLRAALLLQAEEFWGNRMNKFQHNAGNTQDREITLAL